MNVAPLVPPDFARLAAGGGTRYLRRGPRTFAEILSEASAEMDEEDRRLEMARDPVAWLRAHRPRRRLIDVLLGSRRR